MKFILDWALKGDQHAAKQFQSIGGFENPVTPMYANAFSLRIVGSDDFSMTRDFELASICLV